QTGAFGRAVVFWPPPRCGDRHVQAVDEFAVVVVAVAELARPRIPNAREPRILAELTGQLLRLQYFLERQVVVRRRRSTSPARDKPATPPNTAGHEHDDHRGDPGSRHES